MQGFSENSTFPYYCQHCGLVGANIAKLITQSVSSTPSNTNKATCPKCGNTNIDQYGKPPASIPSNKKEFPALQAWGFKANGRGNLCPACKQMTLDFHSSHVRYD